MVAKVLKKEENKQHTLPIIIAATEDKSWRVRLELSKIFSEVLISLLVYLFNLYLNFSIKR
jgi:hypothetical protein